MTLVSSIIDEVHVLLAATVMFLLLPLLALPRSLRTASAMLAVGVGVWLTVVSLLAYFSMVRYAIIFVIAFVGIMLTKRVLPSSAEGVAAGGAQGFRLWDSFEQPVEAVRWFVRTLRVRSRRIVLMGKAKFGWSGLLIIAIAVGWSLVVGSWPWLHQAAPGTPNGYTDLLRIASMAANNGVYPSGAAPIGLAALGATLSSAFFLPAMEVLRFLYPLAGLFTVLAVGAFSDQVFQSPQVTALTMLLASVSRLSTWGLPINFETPLAVHWALVMVLVGVAEAIAWRRQSTSSRMVLSGMAFLGAALLSPPEAAAGLLVASVMAAPRGLGGLKYVMGGVTIVVVGSMPVVGGIMTGHPLSPDGWLRVAFPPLTPLWRATFLVGHYALVWVGLGMALLNQWRPVDPIRRRLGWAAGAMAVGGGALGFMPAVATTVLFSGMLGLLAMALAIDLLVAVLLAVQPGRPHVSAGALLSLAVLGILSPSGVARLHRYEPPLAGRTTLQIENRLPPYQWTIVSPVEQYSEALGRGWHEELSSFVTTYTLTQAKNATFQLKRDRTAPILTPDIFLFVEPKTFPNGTPVSRSDLKIPIAPGTAAYSGVSLQAVESRAYYWAVAYHRSHPNHSQILVKSPHLMVLWIRQ